jgi:phosphoribosylglycinamide formyltransferase-1
MYKIVILCSTSGTDIPAVHNAVRTGQLKDTKISCIVTNTSNAPVVEKARELGIKYKIIEKGEKTREEYDRELAVFIDTLGADLILMIGWMRILSKEFIDRYLGKIVNIHPSLLPDFAGGMDLNVHEEVLKAGVAETGCTLHFATEVPDAGPIIVQRRVSIAANETPRSLKEKVQFEEQIAIVDGIRMIQEGKIKFKK